MLLQNILRENRSDAQNMLYAQMPIYGRAYIKVDGQYVYGDPVAYSLLDLLTVADARWESLTTAQRDSLLEMYDIYYTVAFNWELPNIRENY